MLRRSGDRLGDVTVQCARVIDNRHRPAAKHVRWADQHRVADLAGDLPRLLARHRQPVRRLGDPEIPEELREPLPVLREIDRVGRRADDVDASRLQVERQLQRRLTAELHDGQNLSAALLLPPDHRTDVLERERLEVEPVNRVVVGRDGLRVAVDHYRLVALLAQGEGGVAAAVVELDPLADPVGTAPENHDLRAVGRVRLALPFVRAVEVRRERLEFGGARIDPLVDRMQVHFVTPRRNRLGLDAEDDTQLLVAEAGALEREQQVVRHLARTDHRRGAAQFHDLRELRQEPRIDTRRLVHLLDGPTRFDRLEHRPHPAVGR